MSNKNKSEPKGDRQIKINPELTNPKVIAHLCAQCIEDFNFFTYASDDADLHDMKKRTARKCFLSLVEQMGFESTMKIIYEYEKCLNEKVMHRFESQKFFHEMYLEVAPTKDDYLRHLSI